MKTMINTILLITFAIASAFSQDLSGVWHGNTKTPDNKEILFVFLFEKNKEVYNATMAVHNFEV